VTSGVAATVTLTVGGNNQSNVFSGKIQNGTGTVALTKTGTGTLTLVATSQRLQLRQRPTTAPHCPDFRP
jgi:hypothetical protein